MSNQPTLLVYCQHSLGMGHLKRSIALAHELTRKFQVVFLNGGPIPEAIYRPKDIRFVDLPPLGMGDGCSLITRNADQNLASAKQYRRQMILEQFHKQKPDVVLIELFPFGRKKFAFELMPLLRAARSAKSAPLILCSLRDILVDRGGHRQHRHDNRARWLADRYFDAVLVHSDQQFCRLEETFNPAKPLNTKVFYTGFVASSWKKPARFDCNPGIVVSAGGGSVGGKLLRTAAKIQPHVWRQWQVPMTLVAGPFLPEPEWRGLQTRGNPNLSMHRSVADLRYLLANARASISQCGYNTVMDLLQTRVPALLVPYSEGNENEQLRRAQKLANLDAALYLEEDQLSPATLLKALERLMSFQTKPTALNMDGAKQTTLKIAELLKVHLETLGNCHGEVA